VPSVAAKGAACVLLAGAVVTGPELASPVFPRAAAKREAATSEGETLEVDHGFGGGDAGLTFSQYFATFRRKDVKRFPKGANDSREWRAQKT
jgi:hypothetical protein